MLVFNEGLPRSGKSYDVVKNHICPAIQAGRKVFARVNGLDHDRIADYLGMNVELVRDLLVLVTTAQVKTLFLAKRDLSSQDQEWTISDELKNALFVVDECHEFYVASRESINPAIEQFFALCGQNGMDGVLLSQWYRRLHSSVRARIERKNVFQKLTAVGFEKKYNVTRYHTLSPDRFEKIATETYSYDPKVYPLYKGYADGAGNTAVYKAGGKTVWHKIGAYAVFVVPVVLGAVYLFMHFFGSNSGLAKAQDVQPVHALAVTAGAPAPSNPVSNPMQPHHGKMDGGQAYVFDLADKSRPRLAGVVTMDGEPARGVIEFRQDGGLVLDRLDFAQLRELGVTVEVHGYGVKLMAGKDVRYVTSWPLDVLPAAAPAGGPVQSSAVLGQGNSGQADAAGVAWPSGVGKQEYKPPGTPGTWDATPLPGAKSRG